MRALLLSVITLLFVSQAQAISYVPQHISSTQNVTGDIVFAEGTATIVNHNLPSCGAGNDGDTRLFRGNGNTHCHTIVPATGQDIDGAGGGQTICNFQAALLSCAGAGSWKNTGYFVRAKTRNGVNQSRSLRMPN